MANSLGGRGGRFLATAAAILVCVCPAFGLGLQESVRQQMLAWAEESGDVASALRISREMFQKQATPENHVRYALALIEADARTELLEHLAARRDELPGEAGLWRSFFPELPRRGLFEAVSPDLEEAWRKSDEAEVVFALAELRVFQGRLEEAAALFWTIFEMEETAVPQDGRAYFQRLNHFFHNRFAVKNRLGQATGAYGTDMCREFFFLGMRKDFDVAEIGMARDVALLYLRELAVPAGKSAEFLQRIREGLDRLTRPPAQRILAFAGAGAPGWMLEEVDAFVQSPVRDNAAAEFSLSAMNRFVLSTEKFPELRQPMGDLARAMSGKFDEDCPVAARDRSQQMQSRILARLGLDDPAADRADEAEPGSREDYFARIGRAAEERRPAEAERHYREFREQPEFADDDSRGVLLFLARSWQEKGDGERAAALIAEFLEPIYAPRGGSRVQAPLQWPDSVGFPPANRFLDAEDLEVLSEAFQAVEGTAAWKALTETLAWQAGLLPVESRAGACVARSALHWWAGERDEAVAAARACVEELDDPEVTLLFAHLLGLQKQYGEGIEVLEKVSRAATESGAQARRLRFAFAVAGGNGDEVGARARDLADASLSGPEKVRVAFGLSSAGLGPEAEVWLDGAALGGLGAGEDDDLYERVRLRVLLDREDYDGAAAEASSVLMGQIPDSFGSLLSPKRKEALGALAAAGQLEDYRRHLRELLALTPGALSLRLLLGESADFRWQAARNDDEGEAGAALAEAVDSYGKAVAIRPGYLDLRLDFCEWLAERGLWEEAVAHYQEVLPVDAQAALLDSRTLFGIYRKAGRLALLVDFLEGWQAPEASSMDEFYGLQPTEHLLRPLGELLLEEGEREAAARAWAHGLRINPIGFTEQMRVALAELHAADGDSEKVLELLRGYVAQENLDAHIYTMQPFASVSPRWIAALSASANRSVAPVERLIALATKDGDDKELRIAARSWREEMPEHVSPAAFDVYLSARAGTAGWRTELVELEERFAAEEGPLKGAWEAVEALFEDR